jgi:type I restriction enzyme R subunit
MQAVFGNDAAEVYEESDGRNHAKNARVHVATYQTLGIDRPGADPSFLFRHYPENYFNRAAAEFQQATGRSPKKEDIVLNLFWQRW